MAICKCTTPTTPSQTMWCDLFFWVAKTNMAYHQSRKQRKSEWACQDRAWQCRHSVPWCAICLVTYLGLHRLFFPSPAGQLFMGPEWGSTQRLTQTVNQKSYFHYVGPWRLQLSNWDFLRVSPVLEFLKNWELLLNMTFPHTHWMVWTLFSSLTKELD